MQYCGHPNKTNETQEDEQKTMEMMQKLQHFPSKYFVNDERWYLILEKAPLNYSYMNYYKISKLVFEKCVHLRGLSAFLESICWGVLLYIIVQTRS